MIPPSRSPGAALTPHPLLLPCFILLAWGGAAGPLIAQDPTRGEDATRASENSSQPQAGRGSAGEGEGQSEGEAPQDTLTVPDIVGGFGPPNPVSEIRSLPIFADQPGLQLQVMRVEGNSLVPAGDEAGALIVVAQDPPANTPVSPNRIVVAVGVPKQVLGAGTSPIFLIGAGLLGGLILGYLLGLARRRRTSSSES